MTIFALSSGTLPAGVAVIRLSGSKARFAFETLSKRPCPKPRQSIVCTLYHPVDNQPLDQVLVLYFAGPASFTGEDIVELHCHGSKAVLAIVLDCLSGLEGLRPAEAGEFSRRAFENGKLDLTAVEGLGDLINAETEMQRRQAFQQMGGGLETLYSHWRSRLVKMRALIEADLDFADEEDVPSDVNDGLFGEIDALREEIDQHLDEGVVGERVRDGFRIALIGAPNVGKSSLLNALVKRDVAIVMDQPGTTRDVIEVPLDLDGYPVSIFDTAGLRQTSDDIEREGIRRSRVTAEQADLIVHLSDGPNDTVQRDELKFSGNQPRTLMVLNKMDLIESDQKRIEHFDCMISARTGEGLSSLLERVAEEISDLCAGGQVGAGRVVWTRARHKHLLIEARDALDQSRNLEGLGLELVAESLRQCGDSLGRLIGVIDVDDLLDVIFRDFCIGK